MIDPGDKICVRMTARTKHELEGAEYGSYEDHIHDEVCPQCKRSGKVGEGEDERPCPLCKGRGLVAVREEPYNDGSLHIVEMLRRTKAKDRVYLHGKEEIERFFESAMSGTFGIYCLGPARRIYKELLPYVSNEVKRRNPYHLLGY